MQTKGDSGPRSGVPLDPALHHIKSLESRGVARILRHGVCKVVLPLPSLPFPFPFRPGGAENDGHEMSTARDSQAEIDFGAF